MARTARALVLEKQAQALSLVRAGHSYDQIAEELGYASRSSAWRLVTNGLKSTVDHIAEDHLLTEIDRLDALQAALWETSLAGDIGSATVVLHIIAQRVRLLGLEKRRPESTPMRTLLSDEAYQRIRNQKCNEDTD